MSECRNVDMHDVEAIPLNPANRLAGRWKDSNVSVCVFNLYVTCRWFFKMKRRPLCISIIKLVDKNERTGMTHVV